MKTSRNIKSNNPLPQCPYCKKLMHLWELENHLKERHIRSQSNKKVQITVPPSTSTLAGVEVTNPDLIQKIKHYKIDEHGILVNPDLLQENAPRGNSFEHFPPQKSKPKKPRKHLITQQPANPPAKIVATPPVAKKTSKSIDDIYREKKKWLEEVVRLDKISTAIDAANAQEQEKLVKCPFCKVSVKPKKLWRHFAKTHPTIQLSNEQIYQLENGKTDGVNSKQIQKHSRAIETPQQSLEAKTKLRNLVQCPLCSHKTQYNVLFVHIQVSHPEKNPKIVMAEFNREYKKKKNEDKIDRDMSELVKDYEKLKQSQDEPRDGGKYLGHMRRENGKFGSLPLYDDYSDEADSE